MRAGIRYRSLKVTFWSDPTVAKLSLTESHLYLYLLLGPNAHLCGLYRMQKVLMEKEAGLGDACDAALDALVQSDRISWDREREIVFVKRMLAHAPNQTEKMIDAVLTQLLSLHGTPLINEFLDRYGTLIVHQHDSAGRMARSPQGDPLIESLAAAYERESAGSTRPGQQLPLLQTAPPPAPRPVATPMKQATSLPDDFMLTPERRAFAEAEHLSDIDKTFATFRDHWRAQPGVKGRKDDWDAVWRNWCRREPEFKGRKTGFLTAGEKKEQARKAAHKLARDLDEQERHGNSPNTPRITARRQENGVRSPEGDDAGTDGEPDDADAGGQLGRDH
jgi:hypothetical protein